MLRPANKGVIPSVLLFGSFTPHREVAGLLDRLCLPGPTAIGLLLLLALAGCAARTTPPKPATAEVEAERRLQYGLAAEQLLRHMERVSRVGARITVAGAPFCGTDVKPYVGVLSASRGSVARQLGRHEAWLDAGAALRDAWEIDGAPEVLAVLPGSPAAEAGIRAGDHVVGIESEGDGPAAPLWIEVERRNETSRHRLRYVAECDYPVVATIGDILNAHVAGETITITTGLIRFVESDDELAAVIGHEVAHRLLGHRRSRLRSRESAADYLGVYLAARAGYDPTAASRFVRRLAAEHPELISERASPAHPSTATRVAALDRTVDEIREKQRRGGDLFPDPLAGL